MEGNNRIFVIELDMDNRSAEDIAMDAVMEINKIMDNLVEEQKGECRK